jgi:hypothetical protein
VFNRSNCEVSMHPQVGCGAGNTVYPLLDVTSLETVIYACDFSAAAVDLVRWNTQCCMLGIAAESRCHIGLSLHHGQHPLVTCA